MLTHVKGSCCALVLPRANAYEGFTQCVSAATRKTRFGWCRLSKLRRQGVAGRGASRGVGLAGSAWSQL